VFIFPPTFPVACSPVFIFTTFFATVGGWARVFLDLSADGAAIGRLVVALEWDVAPRTAEHFRAQCLGAKGPGYRTGRGETTTQVYNFNHLPRRRTFQLVSKWVYGSACLQTASLRGETVELLLEAGGRWRVWDDACFQLVLFHFRNFSARPPGHCL